MLSGKPSPLEASKPTAGSSGMGTCPGRGGGLGCREDSIPASYWPGLRAWGDSAVAARPLLVTLGHCSQACHSPHASSPCPTPLSIAFQGANCHPAHTICPQEKHQTPLQKLLPQEATHILLATLPLSCQLLA